MHTDSTSTTLELTVRAQNAFADLREKAVSRFSEQRGQTAAEYMGILVIVALLVAAVIASGADTKITQAVKGAIASLSSGKAGQG